MVKAGAGDRPCFYRKSKMSNPHLQVKNESVLTEKFKELHSIPSDASDIQISVGIHATKITYKVPFLAPTLAPKVEEKPMVKKKAVKKKVVKKDD